MNKFYNLIDELNSPLTRIALSNHKFKEFSGDFLATHIGSGYFISVFHPFLGNYIPRRIANHEYEILINKVSQHRALLNKHYISKDGFRQLSNMPEDVNQNRKVGKEILELLKGAGFDITINGEYIKGNIRPVAAFSFKENLFFKQNDLTKKFKAEHIVDEGPFKRTSFLIELEIVFYDIGNDLAVFKVKDIDKDVIDIIPFIELDYTLLDFTSTQNLLCIQGSPTTTLGKTLNKSFIEGIVDNVSLQPNNTLFEGTRYLIKTYFRFGSSGAPYVFYDEVKDKFVLNAVQSEACPIQMDINGIRNGMQYTHALASPIRNIQDKIQKLIN